MIKKITLSVAVLAFAVGIAFSVAKAEDHDSMASTSPASSVSHTPKPTPSPVDVACMKAAVQKRDTAIAAAVDAQATAWKNALSTRMTALSAAWDLSNAKDRKAAMRLAWKNYTLSRRDAKKAFDSSRHAAWTQFNTDRKACHPGRGDSELGSENSDK